MTLGWSNFPWWQPPNVQNIWPEQTEKLCSSHWSNCKFCDLNGRKWLNQLTLGTGGFPGIHMVGWGGGGVGWGMITFFALAHMVGATQHHGMGWGGVGWGMITFLALAHMVGATQHHLSCTCTHGRCYATSWDGVGWGGVGDDNVPCTCTHGRRYATSSFLYLHTWSLLRNIMGWGGVGWGGGW